MQKCLLDMDGVLVDFVRGAMELHDLPRDLYSKPESMGEFDLAKLCGLEPHNFWKHMGYDFWATLQWTEDGQNILNLAIHRFGLQNVCLLTSPCATVGCIDGKMAWIRMNAPFLKRQFLIGPAKEFCSNPDHILIDDSDKNCESFEKHGGKALLVPRPWNKNHQHSHRTFDYLSQGLGDY